MRPLPTCLALALVAAATLLPIADGEVAAQQTEGSLAPASGTPQTPQAQPPAAQAPTVPPAAPATPPSAAPPPPPASRGETTPVQPQSYARPAPGGYTPGQPYAPPVGYRTPSHPDLPSRPAGDRVSGGRGYMDVADGSCSMAGVTGVSRRRIVALAAGEWSTFAFPVLDITRADRIAPTGVDFEIVPEALNPAAPGRVVPRLIRLGEMEDDARVLPTIGGYWSATPGGSGMVGQQNRVWGASSNTAGWAQPWSAAFISWVMCEAGFGDQAVFRRADAHREYIDQAILARESGGRTAYTAYDIGEAQISPGDMLCFANDRPYRTIADRRRELGQGAATHCDIVVKLDPARERIHLIGGNITQAVTMTIARASRRAPGGPLVPFTDQYLPGSRPWFAHLRLNAGPVADNVLEQTLPITNLRVLAASQGLLRPTYPALSNPAAVPAVAPPPAGPAAAAPPVRVAPPPLAAPPVSTPVPNPPGA